ncbi:MAG: twin-arginine translocation signal domain-containing protein [Bacteroidetes bacterium]|nr:twin-arginine translocation signal domain-containing protein [Bacteroidota bacterium]
MAQNNSTANRRQFLGTLAASAAALGVASISNPLNALANSSSRSGLQDVDAWLDKIKGSHKQVFDAPEPRNGLPFAWAKVFMMTNNQTGTPDSDLTAVVVLRHDAIPLAMEDKLWTKYNFGEFFDVKDFEGKNILTRNMFWKPKEGELPLPGMSIDELQKSGALFCVCDMALTVNSMRIGGKMNMNPEDIKKEWVAGLLPDIQVVPSGVWAVNRAQERGCSYCFAG